MRNIYYNGKVYTGILPLAEAFIVENDKFTFTGSSMEALSYARDGDSITDLDGRFVCAGFNDSHMHLLGYGNALNTAALSDHTDSLEGMISYFREFAEAHPAGKEEWIIGRGWNQDYFTDSERMPDRHDLDRVSSERPVVAVRCCGHALVINSRAIELLGITAQTTVPEGGGIGIENGEPDGRLFDNAMEMVYSRIPAPDKEQVKQLLRSACAALNSYGVTSCQTDDFETFSNLSWREVMQAYQELEAAGELSVRVYAQCNFTNTESLTEFINEGNMTGKGTDFFKIGPLKLLGDGALGARTALLSRPYADDPSTSGLPVFDEKTINDMVSLAHNNGMQCAVHAIGDRCLDWVLNAYESALKEQPREDHRHGIVHCQITRADQLRRMIDMNMHIYAQTIFIDYDSRIVRDRVGDELASTSYNWKTLMDNGISVSNGTDCPVEKPDALRGIQCAVTRHSIDGGDVYLPDQAFSVKEAIDSYTIHGAEASFEEKIKGRIVPGMLADFTVLSEDPFAVDPCHVSEIEICAVYVGGKNVYRKDEHDENN